MTESHAGSSEDIPPEQFPMAEVQPARWSFRTWFWRTWPVWAVGFMALGITAALVVLSLGSTGPQIVVHFAEGHGIKPGDKLRHRGIEVGEVISVELDSEFEGVLLRLELTPQAEVIAREGSQFWIERPRISLSRISGLDTVVGAKYVGVLPGSQEGPTVTRFEGMDAPPLFQNADSVDISVHFENGYGLAAGDVVKHRGIVIGEVTSVELDSKFEGVDVRVRLVGRATGLARAGSQFWVERPRVSVGEIRGLETLVGGRYLAVQPGPDDAEVRQSFLGLESAPLGELPAGGLEIVLQGSVKHGLEPGTPVMYRGEQVGQIVSVGLAHDSASVDARAFIQPDYRNLVRDNTRFWSNSGIRLRLGLSGLEVGTETLSNLAMGGVSFATPTQPGDLVTTGKRFEIADGMDSDWKDWEPRIAVGTGFLREGLSFPTPQRVTLRWSKSFLGITRTYRRQGWVLIVDEGQSLLGPADLLSPEPEALDETVLEIAGREIVISSEDSRVADGVAIYSLNDEPLPAELAWSKTRLRTPTELESALLVADPQTDKLPLPTERLSTQEDSPDWFVDPSVPLDAEWHGGCLIAVKDGKLIGFVVSRDRPARVICIPQKLIPATADSHRD